MFERPWNRFFREKMLRMCSEKRSVIDIGGGLRIDKTKNNRYDASREWLRPLLANVEYRILDKVADYNPDVVGDIHALPFEDNSQEAIVCIAVLEHVEDPAQAIREIYRTLKPGGFAFLYVPFLYYYHAHEGYYKDFWRFTKDGIVHLTRDFSERDIVPVRGAIETWLRVSPLGRSSIVCDVGFLLDRLFGKLGSNQVSGYNVFLVK